jgi:hypothetical protein
LVVIGLGGTLGYRNPDGYHQKQGNDGVPFIMVPIIFQPRFKIGFLGHVSHILAFVIPQKPKLYKNLRENSLEKIFPLLYHTNSKLKKEKTTYER